MAIPKGQLLAATLLGFLAVVNGKRVTCDNIAPEVKTVYDFSATNIYENETISFSRYKGDVLAIINLATFWGLTRPHYVGMNALSTEFMGANFKVLGFPCNNFNLQEPGANYSEILNGIKYVRPGGGFVPNFQMFKKIDVNGKDEHPLYTYLKSMCGPTSDTFEDSSMLYYEPKMVSDVRWNFEVFLINKDGHPLYRYSPDAPISDIEFDIRQLLNVRKSSTSDEQPIVKSRENPLETESVESTSTSEDREENTNEIDLEEYVPNPEEMKDTESY